MAVGLLPGISASSPNSRTGSDGHLRECIMCGVAAPSSASTSSSVTSAPVFEAGSSFQKLSVFGSGLPLHMHGSASGRRSYCPTGAVCFQGGLSSSRRCCLVQEFRDSASIGRNDRRGSRFTASATKDSSRDVFLQTNSHEKTEVPSQRLQAPRSGEAEKDTGAEEEEETCSQVLPEEGKRLNSESSASGEVDPPQEEKQDDNFGNNTAIGTIALGLGVLIAIGGFGAVGFLYKDQINEFLIQFSDFIEGYGPAGYGLFVLVYAGLELLAIPAIPLTMSAGLLFGTVIGTVVVSTAGTIAATGAFLIARYLARDRILEMTKGNKKFLAIDKAIGEDGFRVVTLLRLSPLLPFSLGNYLYGLTSVKLGPYVLGSWLGMLPGTWAYVSAGAIGRAFIVKQESEPIFSGGPEQLWTIGLGLAATVFAASYVTGLAKEALKDIDD